MATISEKLDNLIDKIITLATELKTRNEIDSKQVNGAAWERRFLIIVIAALAGIDVFKFVGLI